MESQNSTNDPPKDDEDTKKKTLDKEEVEETSKTKRLSLTEGIAAGAGAQSDISVTSFEESLMFRCREFDDLVLSQHDWKLKFREQLSILKETDAILAAILTIKSLNPPREAEQCVTVLEKYMKNLIEYPDIDKYRCIRLGNLIFNEKVLSVEGGMDFLSSVGFKTAVGGQDNTEPYLVYSPGNANDLDAIVKSLRAVCGFQLELDRDMRIVHPKEKSKDEDISDEFYEWTLKDMKTEHKTREEEREKRLMFRSRRAKENEGKGGYSYTKMRVRFPDGVMVEAVFSIKEKLYNLKSFLLSKFYFYDNFNFMALPSRVFNVLDEEKTFAELELFPNATLMLKWEKNSPGKKYALKESC